MASMPTANVAMTIELLLNFMYVLLKSQRERLREKTILICGEDLYQYAHNTGKHFLATIEAGGSK
jgi:hypothetical protein